jgi:hypothetical protein
MYNYIDVKDLSDMTGVPTKLAVVFGSAAASYMMIDYFGGGKCYSKTSMKGKTVVITGCNTGIGKETALDMTKRGAKVIMACRNLEAAEKTAQEIRASTDNEGGEVVVKKLDLANLASIRAFAEEVFFLETIKLRQTENPKKPKIYKPFIIKMIRVRCIILDVYTEPNQIKIKS